MALGLNKKTLFKVIKWYTELHSLKGHVNIENVFHMVI